MPRKQKSILNIWNTEGEYAKLHLKRTFADSKGNATTATYLKSA